MSEKSRIFASFSMGKSSAVMCKILIEKYSDTHEIIFGCANTTQELRESLIFGERVDRFLSLDCKVIEAVVHHDKRVGSTHKLTTWSEARMNGEVFREVILKYGIPNVKWPHCTRELKTNPITSYLRSIGWVKGSYKTAIGYRADEMDRVPVDFKERDLIFPLIDAGITKEDVYKSFNNLEQFPFTLEIEEHEGNCKACFKKNDRKLLTLMRDYPERFDFIRSVEKAPFCFIGSEFNKYRNQTLPPRRFFRRNRATWDLEDESREDFESFTDELYQKHYGECQESCEPFVTDNLEQGKKE